jgi:hypothetical protein
VPKFVAGPYLLYGAFAAWHFHLTWWAVLIFAAWGCLMCILAFIELRDRQSRFRR